MIARLEMEGSFSTRSCLLEQEMEHSFSTRPCLLEQEMEDSFSIRPCLLEQEIKGVAHFLSCHLQSSRQDTSLSAQMFTQVLLKTVLPDGTIALASYGSMWISIRYKSNENTTCTEGV